MDISDFYTPGGEVLPAGSFKNGRGVIYDYFEDGTKKSEDRTGSAYADSIFVPPYARQAASDAGNKVDDE